ncbi:2-oxoisovalerate dehydrogenase subunit alpha 2, mitochondrial isoform X2 [Vigna radiata var. radiata]|uniref:2-oxoisovalerate dehydrogenase subunit alpha 2, mitochondrial isoform X2 n=1 Tax=Vigna radiata var. radiata TaxID=3916 RepID=A0A1S3TER6_VIGRR|nr:2-oxoisovalerate dehydrogenase subunit alpha 2, mitochondrial isoform X2 [Vigna radiata var. radiata]
MKLRRSNNNSINSKKIHFGESPNDVLFMRLAFHTMRKFVTIFSFFKSRKNFSSSLHRNSPRCSNQLHPNFRNLTQNCDLLLPPLSSHRLFSDIAGNPSTLNRNLLQDQGIDFPGGRVEFVPEMKFISESVKERVPCYRVLDDNGQPLVGHNFVQVSKEVAVKMYTDMVTLRSMDTIFYEAQRQGRISFYVTAIGEEAINIASAAALSMNDVVFPQGDFHAALNFAAVTEAPVIFICRNNGWAISTPISDQFRSDGVVVKGQSYGVRSIRVDGNDALAIYSAVQAARQMSITEERPILIEALTYRVGHHTTSDDSTKYRPASEIEWWRVARDPVARFRKWLENNGWWNDLAESELINNLRQQLLHTIQVAESVEKPPLEEAFRDVYDVPPSNLREQEQWLKEIVKEQPQEYPPNISV